jgi:hypothetical protein
LLYPLSYGGESHRRQFVSFVRDDGEGYCHSLVHTLNDATPTLLWDDATPLRVASSQRRGSSGGSGVCDAPTDRTRGSTEATDHTTGATIGDRVGITIDGRRPTVLYGTHEATGGTGASISLNAARPGRRRGATVSSGARDTRTGAASTATTDTTVGDTTRTLACAASAVTAETSCAREREATVASGSTRDSLSDVRGREVRATSVTSITTVATDAIHAIQTGRTGSTTSRTSCTTEVTDSSRSSGAAIDAHTESTRRTIGTIGRIATVAAVAVGSSNAGRPSATTDAAATPVATVSTSATGRGQTGDTR